VTEQKSNTEPRGGYFERVAGDKYVPTADAGGAWNPTEVHFSPLSGLITHAIDLHRQATEANEKRLSRISFDILGFLAADECDIKVETIRPGRTIELVEATVAIGGRAAVLARAWFMSEVDTTRVAGGEPERLPNPNTVEAWDLTQTWDGGWVASLEERAITPPKPGRTTAWLRTDIDLVTGEPASPHARFITLVDTANGIAARQSPKEWMFPNLDLTIHLYRQPTGPWVGLDTTVTFGPSGQGLTRTTLHDEVGPVGTAAQTLTVRPIQ
jgi:acyl-CoA thioesterase